MDGKKLIEYICVLLDNQDKRLTDSNIIMQLRTMNEHTLKTLANKNEMNNTEKELVLKVGNSFNFKNIRLSHYLKVCTLDENTVVIWKPYSKELMTFRFNGTDWVQLGTSYVEYIYNIASLTSTRIVLVTEGELLCYDFDGTDWKQVGKNLELLLSVHKVVRIGDNKIVILLFTRWLETYDFDGKYWEQIGNSLEIPTITDITSLGNDRIAVTTEANEIKSYELNEEEWVNVGTEYERHSTTFDDDSIYHFLPMSKNRFVTLGKYLTMYQIEEYQ